MSNAITIIIFTNLLGGAFFIEKAVSESKSISMSMVETCFKRELDSCGDKICEMSTDDNYEVIRQAFDNVRTCLEGAK